MRKDILECEKQIRSWIKENRTKAFICSQLKCKPETLESYLTKMGIEYRGNSGRKGFIRVNERKKPQDYLIGNSTTKTHVIRLWLLRDKIKDHQCESCLNTKWLNGLIPLEVHHVDGDPSNNKLENLQLLCPNCHSLTDNNSGKGTGKRARLENRYIALA